MPIEGACQGKERGKHGAVHPGCRVAASALEARAAFLCRLGRRRSGNSFRQPALVPVSFYPPPLVGEVTDSAGISDGQVFHASAAMGQCVCAATFTERCYGVAAPIGAFFGHFLNLNLVITCATADARESNGAVSRSMLCAVAYLLM